MPAYNGRIVIAGVAESDYGRVPNMTEMQLHAQSLQRALEDSGLRKEEIDGVFCSSQMMGMPTVMLCEYLRIFPRYSDSTSSRNARYLSDCRGGAAVARAMRPSPGGGAQSWR
jgi:acetyl-CoA C-acetyltransferase